MQAALGTHFTIERELGGAGAAHVFVAEEHALGRRVVIKMLPKNLANSVDVERFQREIAVAARLQHPHLVPLLTAGVVSGAGVPWFSMPFVEGETLRELLVRRGALPMVTAARLLREMASGLAYAHGRGVVHRDIKPENVLLSDGVAMVTDFGVAMAVDSAIVANANGRRRLTGAGTTLGTPAYSAPEQISAAELVDHRADVYSLGCVAYEMLTGASPFEGRSLRELLHAQIHETPIALEHARSGIPPSLGEIVMRCLAKDPNDRPSSASDVVKTIDDLTITTITETGENPAVTSERLRATTRPSPAGVTGSPTVSSPATASPVVTATPKTPDSAPMGAATSSRAIWGTLLAVLLVGAVVVMALQRT